MDMHHNCWVVAINSKENGYIKPIIDKLCFKEIVFCQEDEDAIPVELTFHQRFKPIATYFQELHAMSDQMDTNTPIFSHIVVIPDQPVAE